jgi:hypothetical protein
MGDNAMTTRTSEKAIRASRKVSPSTLNTTDAVHIQVKPAAKVLTDAVKIIAHLFRNNRTKSSRISIEKANGCVRSTTDRALENRSGILRNKYERNEPVKRPTAEKSVDDLKASHQNMNDTTMSGTPTTTANVCSDVAVPRSTGAISKTLGRPHVVNEGTTAVAMTEDAIVR